VCALDSVHGLVGVNDEFLGVLLGLILHEAVEHISELVVIHIHGSGFRLHQVIVVDVYGWVNHVSSLAGFKVLDVFLEHLEALNLISYNVFLEGSDKICVVVRIIIGVEEVISN
jgi:hypothetical protein